MEKVSLFGKTLSDLKGISEEYSLPNFTAKQIADWLYKKHVNDITEMNNLSLKVREKLSEFYKVGRYAHSDQQVSIDGTIKYLFTLTSGNFIESVYIPEVDRATLCVSSQAGCKMGCKFCMTARQGFKGNLTSGEILNQLQSLPEYENISNIVFMGMGEPMDNIEEVLKALEILTSDYAYAWSPKRITVSTIGVKEGMLRFLNESKCHLAVSLHSPFDEERKELMPMQKAYPLKEIIASIKQYDFTGQRRVSFEYIMFEGINDTEAHAKALVALLKGLECRMNLIRFHRIPDSSLAPSSEKDIENFKSYLNSKGLFTTIRSSRGEDIFAACGMLSGNKTHNNSF